MTTLKRIGFACKWAEVGSKGLIESTEGLNTGSTTFAWINRQTRDVAEQKLWDLMVQNINTTKNFIEKVGTLDEELRMARIGSDLLPLYTHAEWSDFWRKPDVVAYCEKHFIKIGDIARARNVRLSMHPGQFTVLASVNENIVNKSIEEFEYHASMANWMGYGRSFQDFKINVHISGKQGPEGIRKAYERLSPEARNCITIENEENSWGLEDCLTLSDILPIVMDVHHHWIREGEYISPNDSRVKRVIDSWRGVRPTMHYSVSREDVLVDHDCDTLPDMTSLIAAGYKKQKLRAHSDYYWNNAANEWALTFRDNFDIMCESKAKNLASFKLYEGSKNVKQTKELILEEACEA
jgi:UV DNA damage endonuclease